MLDACEETAVNAWHLVKPYAEIEFTGLLHMIDWLHRMKQQSKLTTEEARIHIDIQKATMRTRLMAIPGISMTDAERIINCAVDSIRKDVYDKTNWVII
jgi:hypothetical protein